MRNIKNMLVGAILVALSGCNGLSAGGYVEMGAKGQVDNTCMCRGENCSCSPENAILSTDGLLQE